MHPLTVSSHRVEGWVLRRSLLKEAVLLPKGTETPGHRDAGGEVSSFQAGAGFQNSLQGKDRSPALTGNALLSTAHYFHCQKHHRVIMSL